MSMNIMITLPQKVKWADYEQELAAVADGQNWLNFRVPSLPKYLKQRAKCFLVHRGFVVGWMYVCGLLDSDGFTCTTTGAYWTPGKYVQRSGPFYFLATPIVQKGFQGWHYTELA